MTTSPTITDHGLPDELTVDDVPWRVARAWPRAVDHVPCELARPDGSTVAAQWFGDPSAADALCVRAPGLRRLDHHTVAHEDGADDRLPGLAPLVAAGGDLLAHRPGKRAVVAAPDGYHKLVRPRRVDQLAVRHRQLAVAVGGSAATPSVLAVGDDRVVLGALDGPSLREVGAHPLTGDVELVRAWHATGTVLRTLAATAPGAVPDELPRQDAAAEAEVTRGAVAHAVAGGRLPARDVVGALSALVDDDAPSRLAVAHRDLHDGQVHVGDDGLGLLDPDTLAAAEPALDLANLLVHLELRVAQGLLSSERRRVAVDALLDGADPSPTTLARLPVHAHVAKLRLCAVYSWRPRWRPLAHRWWHELTR